MADDVLTPIELETLLSATGSNAPPRRMPAAGPVESRAAIATHASNRVQSVGQQQLRVLRTLHERFAEGIAAALSAKLRCPLDAKLVSLDQLSYGELLRGLDNPTCIAVLRAAPLAGELGLDINHPILLPIIEGLLGGGREPSPSVRRSLTAIEQRLAARVTRTLTDELRRAWRDVADLEFAVARVEHDPQAARIAPSGEGVVRVRLELAVGAARGLVTICLPGGLLRSIEREPSRGPSVSGAACPASTVALVARLAGTRVAESDLEKLQVGDIITTDGDVSGPLSVCVDGVPRFLAHGGVADGRKAVRIDETLTAPSGGERP